jgi:eukaryotic-like serine/threonine-protein kinase
VGSKDRNLYCIDAQTGTELWRFATEGEVLGAANWAVSPDTGRPWVLFGSYDGSLRCLDLASHELIWDCHTDNYVNGAPAVAGGKVVFGGCDGIVHQAALADGAEAPSLKTDSPIAASAAVDGAQAYVGNYGGKFLCMNTANARVEWDYDSDKQAFFSSPAVGADRVVVGARDNNVYCFSRKKRGVIWKFPTGGQVDSSPVICGGVVVVGSKDGFLYMLGLADGKKLWSYEIGEAITASPAVAAGMIVIGSEDGFVYAFGRK